MIGVFKLKEGNMKIAIGSDHRGFSVKNAIIEWLKENDHEVIDVGTDSKESCDYPDHAAAAARLVHSGAAEQAILICGTGMGMAVVANKFPGVYACVCVSEFEATRIREHNNANCMCLPYQMSSPNLMKMLLRFTTVEFAGGRHARRIDKIKAIEDEFTT